MKIWQFIKDNALRLVAGAAILFVIFLLALFSGLEPMYGIWILLSLLVAGLLGAALVWSVFHREDAVEEDDDLEIEAELTQLAEGFPLPLLCWRRMGKSWRPMKTWRRFLGRALKGKRFLHFFLPSVSTKSIRRYKSMAVILMLFVLLPSCGRMGRTFTILP